MRAENSGLVSAVRKLLVADLVFYADLRDLVLAKSFLERIRFCQRLVGQA